VFPVADGHLIVATDPGAWSADDEFDDVWPDGIEIDVAAPKIYGDNFRAIDLKLSELVRSMIQMRNEHAQ